MSRVSRAAWIENERLIRENRTFKILILGRSGNRIEKIEKLLKGALKSPYQLKDHKNPYEK